MRSAELYRRSVLLPQNSLALVRLEADDVQESTEVLRLTLAEGQWRYVWALINDINRVCGTDLNDRATSTVDLEQLPLLIDHLRTRRYTHPIEAEFAYAVAVLAERAMQMRMPLFFVL